VLAIDLNCEGIGCSGGRLAMGDVKILPGSII
jgi:hypothetical protein